MEQGPHISVALLRIMFGMLYLDMALQKAPWIQFGWLEGFIRREIQHPTFGWYKSFLEQIVIPNFFFFGWMTFLTEIALSVGLLFGLFTVLAGLGGALWQVNIALGAYSVPEEWYWVWPLLIVPQLVFAAARAGRTLGLDRWLSHSRGMLRLIT